MNRKTLASLVAFFVTALVSSSAFAQAAAPANINDTYGMLAIAAGFGIGLAAIGGAYGQGKAAAAALEGIARNPGAAGKLNTPLILSLALIESLVIYAFVITIMMVLKIDVALIK
jgi:F-type H+-transporting ATPase subunit c